jgi:hypothetical protein
MSILRVEATKQSLKDGNLIEKSIQHEPPIPLVLSGKGWSQVWTLPWRMTEKERTTPGGKWPTGWPGAKTYIFRVEISYQDGFGEEKREEVCRQWLPGFSINWTKDQMSSGGGSSDLRDCSETKGFIDSTLEQERKAELGAARPN